MLRGGENPCKASVLIAGNFHLQTLAETERGNSSEDLQESHWASMPGIQPELLGLASVLVSCGPTAAELYTPNTSSLVEKQGSPVL